MRTLMMALAAAVLFANASAAQTTITTAVSGYNYFNRPGATLQQHFDDLEACRVQVGHASQPNGASTALVTMGMSGGIIAGIDGAIAARRARSANYENCMVVRGWRVVGVDEALGRELGHLDQPALALRLATMVGADTPEGAILRVFNNDATRADVTIFAAPDAFDQVSLSLRAMPDRPDQTSDERRAERDRLRALGQPPRTANSLQPINTRRLRELPADAALVVVHIGAPMVSGPITPGVVFERVSRDDRPAWASDGLAADFIASAPMRLIAPAGERLAERTLIFMVPPGRWRVSGMFEGSYSVSFCLGAPSFEIAAGEVVYAGSFYTDIRDRGPDLTLTPAETALASVPELRARLRPAAYANGETFACAGSYIYAFEASDAPYREGYGFGSNALTTAR